LEYRDSNYVLGPKNGRALKGSMTVILTVGFADLPDPKNPGGK
jgi:nucleosome binding factor SPN SPT16 subunit